MRLTDVAFRWAKRLPKGNIFRGKYRLVRKVTPVDLEKLKSRFEIEEKNMFYLRNPYLTREQEVGHAKQFRHRQNYLEKIILYKNKQWEDHKLLGDRFGFLKVSEKWE